MPALLLAEAVQQAQDAIGAGDYRRAVETCRQVLHSYPDCVTAHRLLGEAYLEQRDEASAERAFTAALQRDPQCVGAYVGLGLIAEARREPEKALAFFQAAWEIAPTRNDLRERVVRLASDTYGPEGRLQLTRAALGSIHYQAGRWGRAVNECAAVLAEYPGRVDVRLRLAEALWRRGEWERAAANCRAVLEQSPGAFGALVLLADIERRLGNDEEAAKLRERVRAADPDGSRAAEMLAAVPDRVDFFLPAEPPVVEELAEPAVDVERPRIGPAPDFTAPEIDETPPAAMWESVAPEPAIPVEDAPDAADPFDVPLPSDQELESARPDNLSTAGYTGLLRSLEDSGIEPFDAAAFGDNEAGLPPWVLEPEEPAPTEPEPVVSEPAEPEPPAAAAEPAPEPAEEEPDLSALLGVSSDQEIEAARPDDGPLSGYTGILRSLEDTGLAPFDPEMTGEPAAALPDETPEETPEPEPDFAVPDAAAELDAGETDTSDVLAGDWDSIDQEIREAIPGEMPRGYTDELRSLDAAGIEPFTFDDEEIPFFQRTRQDDMLPVAEEPAAAEEAPVAEEAADTETDIESLGALEVPGEEEVPALAADAADEADAERLLDEVDLAALEGDVEPALAETDLAGLEEEVEPAPTEAVVDEAPTLPDREEVVDAAAFSSAIERLGVGPELVERARDAKEELIASGRISGDQPLEPAAETDAAPVEPEGGEPEGVDLAALEDAVREQPDASDARLALAEGLVAAGQAEAALEHYQWLYRHAPDQSEAVIRGLTRITELAPEVVPAAHRLLGAIYRKRGDVHLASRHYGLAVSRAQGRRGERRG